MYRNPPNTAHGNDLFTVLSQTILLFIFPLHTVINVSTKPNDWFNLELQSAHVMIERRSKVLFPMDVANSVFILLPRPSSMLVLGPHAAFDRSGFHP